MNVDEQQLHDLLHRLTPEPPRRLTGTDVQARLDVQPAQTGQPVRWARWAAPVAAAVVLLLVLGTALTNHFLARRDHPATTPGCSATPPQPPAARVPTAGLLTASDLGLSTSNVQQSPQPGLSNLITGTETYPQWQVMEQGYRFPNATSATDFMAASVAALRCTAGTTELHPSGAANLPDTWFFHTPPGGGYTDGSRVILTRLGTDVLQIETLAPNDPPAGGPGDGFLVGLAAAARAKVAGQPVPAVPAPASAGAAPLPAGFLTVGDLGSGWSLGALPGDSGPVTDAAVVRGPSCGSVALPLAAPGRSVTYRGHQPLGDGEWLLSEQVVELTPAGLATARSSLQTAASGCSGQTVLFGGATIAGDYALALRPSDSAGMATVYLLTGRHLIVLTTLPGGASGVASVPLPGGTAWLEEVARTAVQRVATG